MLSEKLLAHFDSVGGKLAEKATGSQQNFARPEEGLGVMGTLGAIGAGAVNMPAQLPRYAGMAGFGMAKLGQGVTSAFGLAPNPVSEALGERAAATMESGEMMTRAAEDQGGLYRGKNAEQARGVGRMVADTASSFLIPMHGASGAAGLAAKGAKNVLAPAASKGGFLGKMAQLGTDMFAGSAGGAVAGAESAFITPLMQGKLPGQDDAGNLSLGTLGKQMAQGAVAGAAFGAAAPVLGAAAAPVVKKIGRAAVAGEEAARGAYNRAATAVAGENARLVKPAPALGKFYPKEAARVSGAAPKAIGGGSQAAVDMDNLNALADEIQAAKGAGARTSTDAKEMAQVAQAFQLAKATKGGFAQMEANHNTVVDGIKTVGDVIGKKVPRDAVTALQDVQSAKQKLMPVISEANAKVTAPVDEMHAVSIAEDIVSSPEISAELKAQDIDGKGVVAWAKSLAGESQQQLQRIKNSLAQSVSGKKVGNYAGATGDALRLRVVSQLMDDRVVATLGKSNKAVSQQLAKLNAYERQLAGVASVDLRKSDASLSVILANALAHGDLSAAKSGLMKAGWAKAAGAIDSLRGKNNLIASLYEDIYAKGAPSGVLKMAGSNRVGKAELPNASTKSVRGVFQEQNAAPKKTIAKAPARPEPFVAKSESAHEWLSDIVANHNPDLKYKLTPEFIDELAQYRPTEPVKLYRGIKTTEEIPDFNKEYESWTTSKEMAEYFAGDKGKVLERTFQPEDIIADLAKVPREKFNPRKIDNFQNRELEVLVRPSALSTKGMKKNAGGGIGREAEPRLAKAPESPVPSSVKNEEVLLSGTNKSLRKKWGPDDYAAAIKLWTDKAEKIMKTNGKNFAFKGVNQSRASAWAEAVERFGHEEVTKALSLAGM